MDRIELKAAITVDDTGTVEGIAWPFGSPDRYGDEILPGSFKGITGPLPMLAFHDQATTVGVWDSVAETSKGLMVRGRLLIDHVARASEIRALIQAKALAGLSIGFVSKASKARAGGGRTISRAELLEISIVAVPAHPGARITSAKAVRPAIKESLMDNQEGAASEIAAIENKLGALDATVKSINIPDLSPLESRLVELEKKANRPNAGNSGNADEQAGIEKKALAALLRTGTIDEIKSAGGILESKAASSDSDPAGGYFVLPTVDLTIRSLMTDLSPLRGLAEVVSIGTDRYERFYSMGKRGARWVSERDDRPQDTERPELIKHSYSVAELYAAPAATRHLLDDAATDIASWLINNAVHEFAEAEGEAFHHGDGIEGRPRGLQTYPTASQKDFVRQWGTFQYVPAGHASAPTDTNLEDALIAMVASLRKPYKGSAIWLMNSKTALRLQKIKDGEGRRLWAPTGNLIEGVEHPLLGYRVEIDEEMPDIGANTTPIAFGDFRQGYVIVDRQGVHIEIDRVTQKGRVLFDTYKRVGGGAGDFNALKFLKIATA